MFNGWKLHNKMLKITTLWTKRASKRRWRSTVQYVVAWTSCKVLEVRSKRYAASSLRYAAVILWSEYTLKIKIRSMIFSSHRKTVLYILLIMYNMYSIYCTYYVYDIWWWSIWLLWCSVLSKKPIVWTADNDLADHWLL